MAKTAKTKMATERALEIIIQEDGITVRGLAQRLRDEGVYSASAHTFNVGRASIAFARSRIKELERSGKIKSRPNPAMRASEIWYAVQPD